MEQNITGSIKALNVIFAAMLMGQVSFAAIAVGLITTNTFTPTFGHLENIFVWLVPALIIIGWLTGTSLYKKKMLEAINLDTVNEKVNIYKAAFTMRCALLEGPILFAIVAFLLTANMLLLAFAAVGIFLFVLLRPTKQKIAGDLQVADTEW